MFEWLLVFGFCLFIAGIVQFLRSLLHARSWHIVVGTVVRVDEIKDSNDSPSYQPVICYQAHDGKEHQFTGMATGPRQHWYKGDDAAIIYDPKSPSRARMYSYLSLFGLAILLLALSMPFMVIGWVNLIIAPAIK